MATFIKTLFILSLFFTFFSCARREQAFYQPSQREQFTQVNQPTTPAAIESLAPDTTQSSASNEPAEVLASTNTNVPLRSTKPTWESRPQTVESVANVIVNQPGSHVKKAQLRKALLKKIVSDTPGSTNGLAVASLVCGILSFIFLGIVLGPLAIIFGGVALSKIRKNPEVKGRGLAVAGLILGIVATVVLIVFFASR